MDGVDGRVGVDGDFIVWVVKASVIFVLDRDS
jgi:hypothetical protein